MRLAIAMLAAAGAMRADVTLYVATNGNDAWPGTQEKPFATLVRARDQIRKIKDDGRDGRITILVRGGVYELEHTLQFQAIESGTAAAPITIRNYPGEKATITGGKRVAGFKPYKGKILQADVAAQGLRGIYFRQLFRNGKRLRLARYPNYDPSNPYGGGFAYVDGKPVSMGAEIPGEDKHTLRYKPQDQRRWAHPEEGEVFIFPRYNWWNDIVPIQSVDRAARTIALAEDCSYSVRPTDRYYVQNLFEELDAPGEWYLDRRTWTLYLWPPDGFAADPAVYAPRVSTLLAIGPGTEYLIFRGFTFEASQGTAIKLDEASNCLIAGNVIRNAGDYNGSGIEVTGGRRNGVAGNDIYDIGRTGIVLKGGDRITLFPAGHYADNNYIHHVGVYYKQGEGIAMEGCGVRASHNLIHDTPRHGIWFGGNNLLIEYNHVRHTNIETADTGAVNTGGRDWISSRGTVIRYNYLHDVLGYGQVDGKWVSPHYAWGVYLDDNTGGVDVIGNIVARAVRGLVHLHDGRDNLVENNILVGGTLQQVELNGWVKDGRSWKSLIDNMVNGWESVKDQPAWKQMRGMQIDPRDVPLPDGMVMTGNVFRRNVISYSRPEAKLFRLRLVPLERNTFERNLYWHGGLPLDSAVRGRTGEQVRDWLSFGADRDSVIADPLFVDAAKDDYRLRPESPAWKLGFQRIPVEKIGPYADQLRASWPIVEAEGVRERPLK